MKCKACNSNLLICNSHHKSNVGSEDVFIVQELACPNPDCLQYGGEDMSKPCETIEHKVN